MKKITIIGPSGAGKTTLAQKLSSILKIKPIYLDRLFWQRNWEKETQENRIFTLQQLIHQKKQWIIEGTYIHSTDLHLTEADTIIFLDVPSLVCLVRLIKRRYKKQNRPRRDLRVGCVDSLTPYRILKVLTFRSRERKMLQQKLSEFETEKTIIRLRSKKEVNFFLADPEMFVRDYGQSLLRKASVSAVLGWVFNTIFDSFLQVLYACCFTLLTLLRIFHSFANKARISFTHIFSPAYSHHSQSR